MKVLLAIQSCEGDRKNGRQAASENTYLNEWDYLLEYRYFIGRGLTDVRLGKEVFCDVPDDYAHCPWKTQAAVRYAYYKEFDYMFHCCTDTYVVIPRLLSAVPHGEYYVGNVCDERQASGGCGYWLNRKAMQVIAMADPKGGFEDLWVGRTLEAAGIKVKHDPRYRDGKREWDNGTISVHLSTATGNFDPKWMHDCHDDYLRYCT